MVASVSQASPLIPKVNSAATIDGQLDKDEWKLAHKFSLDFVNLPVNYPELNAKTDVYVMENGTSLFIAFDAKDDTPSEIRARYQVRDRIKADDRVGVKIDPYGDSKIAFHFESNPLGVQRDNVQTAITGTSSDSWNGIWSSAGKVTDTGFIVEFEIPLRNFNFNQSDRPQTWKFDFKRVRPRAQSFRYSNIDIDHNNGCWVCQMVPFQGFAGARQGNNLAFVPTLLTGNSRQRDANGTSDWNDTDTLDAGADIKWGINSETVLNATFNPDFSQVEADAGQLNVNNNFNLFFPERRPFFLENAQIFTTNQKLVHTRNIVQPTVGLKISGKTNKHSYGILATDDTETNINVPGSLKSDTAQLVGSSHNAAMRYRYDASSKATIGMLSTLRKADNYHNYLFMVDGRYNITPQDVFIAEAITSDTRYPEDLSAQFADISEASETCEFANCWANETFWRTQHDQPLRGHNYYVALQHRERDWNGYVQYKEISEGFRSDLGFINRADSKQYYVGAGRNWYSNTQWWNRLRLNTDHQALRNMNDEFILDSQALNFSVFGSYQSVLSYQCKWTEQVGNRLDESLLSLTDNTSIFQQKDCSLSGEVRPNEILHLIYKHNSGSKIDFVNNRLADRKRIQYTINANFNSYFKSGVTWVDDTLTLSGSSVYQANQGTWWTNIHFNLRQMVRIKLIYTDIHRNLDNYLYTTPNAQTEKLVAQAIYTYQVNPQSVIYIGYGGNSGYNDELGSFRANQHNIFAKFSYAWLQ